MIAHAHHFEYLTQLPWLVKRMSLEGRAFIYDDLKWRIVWQCEALSLKYSDVAANLGVDSATVWQGSDCI